MPRNSTLSRPGFTLIELLVALAVGIVVVEGARRIVEALVDSQTAVHREAVSVDARENAQLLVRAFVRQLHATTAATDTIVAEPRSVRFTSHCETAFGWTERCRVALTLESSGVENRLVVNTDGYARFDSGFSDVVGPLLFLEQSGNAREWKLLPGERVAALGIVRKRDTLLLAVASSQ